ncbi:MAG: APA family basic amino acid/polyamine antiporter [Limisphaerales bacterium]|jgi:APA family basic amino acid/polyamine antiporter
MSEKRTVGLLGAAQLGIGAIVGGGILALGGVAFEVSGPSAILAFSLNGVIALLTALSFAEIATAFPESGGLYTFAKRIHSVRAAFASGWILWLAYIVAGVLYALGFATYAVNGIDHLLLSFGIEPPVWLHNHRAINILALVSVSGYLYALIRKSTGGGSWLIWGKVLLFGVLICAGFWFLFTGNNTQTTAESMTPFFAGGGLGLLQAMGYCFIALQGFELIASIAGEVKEPRKVIPKAMILALACGLIIYLPFLFITATVGVPEGSSISEFAKANPETVMALGVEQYMGIWGYRLVLIAALLAMLSALQANLRAASRIALAMANDGTLPGILSRSHKKNNTPAMALYASAVAMMAVLFMLPNLATAGAAASLIFLISFALTHATTYLMRKRLNPSTDSYKTPFFPLVPVVGGIACLGLAIFQFFAAPAGGGIAILWLGMGVILYLGLFANRAERKDAFSQAMDPNLVQMRGKSPLVLVPVSNPATAGILTDVGNALAPPNVGRVLLLTIIKPEEEDNSKQALTNGLKAIRIGLDESFDSAHKPEALLTTASDPWAEIARVAEEHRCESLLLGMSAFDALSANSRMVNLINKLSCDVIVVRTPTGWVSRRSTRIIVPIGGLISHDELRARFLGSLMRIQTREIIFVQVIPPDWSEKKEHLTRKKLEVFARDETNGVGSVKIIRSSHVVEAIAQELSDNDLVVLGLQRDGDQRLFGDVSLGIADKNPGMTVLISHSEEGLKIPFIPRRN